MKYIFQNFKLRKLYIFFLFLAVLNVFFSTGISFAKTFSINDLELSTPFKINFNKNKIIDEGFVQAFNQLMLSTVQSKDHQKLKKTPLNQIKSMIETFSIKEENGSRIGMSPSFQRMQFLFVNCRALYLLFLVHN